MSKLERQLGLTSVVAISLSTMLGSGLFVLPGLAAAKTGPSVWMAYLFAGLCVLPAALSKAELATAMPTSGGTYVYLDRAFGPLVGTISGIGLWLSLLLKSAFALFGFSYYLSVLADVPVLTTSLSALALIVALNIRGVRGVSRVQSVTIAISIAGLVAVFLLALGPYDSARLEPMFTEGGAGFLAAAAFVFVSYAGVTKVAAFAEEVKNPERNLPVGMILSLGIAMLLYAGVTLVLVANVDLVVLATDNHPIYTLAETVAGPIAGIAAVVIGFLTLVSMANGGLLAASRFPFAMSRDDLLPSVISQLHERYLTPVPAIVLSGATVAVALVLFDIERIAKLASAFLIMLYMAENIAVIVLREAGAKWYKPTYRSPLYPWMQVFGILACVLLLVVIGPLAAIASAAVALPGAVLYLLYGRARTERRGVIGLRGRRRELLRAPSSEMRAVADPTSDADIVVALFGTQRSPEGLVEHASALSQGGTIHVVYLTELPEQVSLEVVKDDPVVESVRRRVEAMAQEQQLPIVFEAIATRDIIHTIHDLSNRVHCKWLVIEWTGRSAERFTFGNPLGWLKENLSANLAIFHDAGIRYIRKILVLTEPGPHDALVARTADLFANLHGANLTFVRFVPDDAPLTRVQAEADYLDQVRQLCESPSETLILRGRDEVKAIGRASAAFDLLITAEKPHKSMLLRMVGGGRDKLTAAAACSVLRLQTPRVEIHSALEQTAAPRAAPPLVELLDRNCVSARVDQTKKEALFVHFATTFAEHVPEVEKSDVLAQLHERERTQNTAVGHGVALPHATVDAADRTYLGVFTTAAPIDYGAPDGEGVDVFFVTIGPASERQTHLYLLADVSKLALKTSLLYQLRKAEDSEGIVAAIEQSLQES